MAAMDDRASRLRVPAELARLADVRRHVRERARAAGASEDAVDDLVQAADEAATNVVVHGYAGRPGFVEVGLELRGDDLVLVVADEAPAFDPRTVPDPDMAVPALVRGPHGMGVRLIRLATDRLDYAPRAGGGNVLTMTRSRAARTKERSEMALQTTVERVDGPNPVTILALDGELDAASYEQVIETVRQLYADGTRRLVLDLTNLEFISSSGLVAIHSALRIMHGQTPPDPEYGWQAMRAIKDEVADGTDPNALQVVGARDAVWKVIERTGLGGLIPSHPDRASALAAG
jgi:serine/threonine-protein kinase RsbW